MENTPKIPEWLQKLQEKSWEVELLISGGAIFSLFKASGFILDINNYLRMSMALHGQNIILMIVMIGLKLLTFGFIFHLLLRAFWVSMIFINYVYPDGVKKENVRWKKPFTFKINGRTNLYTPVTKIGRLAGIVMFASIVSSFTIAGLLILIIVMLAGVYTSTIFDLSWLYSRIVIFWFIVYFIDLISFGLLRKIRGVSYAVYPVFKLFDWISLRFLFERSLLVLATNINKWKFLLVSTLFVCISAVSAYLTVQKAMHWPDLFDQREYRYQLSRNDYVFSWYEDENPHARVSIPTKIVKGNYLQVKITFWAYDDEYMQLIDKPEKERIFADINELTIDDSLYTALEWYPFDINNICGIKTMVPLFGLENGMHVLEIKNTPDIIQKALDKDLSLPPQIKIPFWKDN